MIFRLKIYGSVIFALFFTQVFAQSEIQHTFNDCAMSCSKSSNKNLSINISYWDDVRRSTVGMIVGLPAGGLIGGLFGKFVSEEDNKRNSSNSKIGSSILIGAGFGSAIGSSLALHMSHIRNDNYLKLASLSLLPTILLVIPSSVYAIYTEEDSDFLVAMSITSVSIISTTFISPCFHRRFQLKQSSKLSINFVQPSFQNLGTDQFQRTSIILSFKIVEIKF